MIEQQIGRTIEVLRRGGLILYPTDTVWGIGCDATDRRAVERIYRLKGSTDKKSMLVLCSSTEMLARHVGTIPRQATEAIARATAPLTLILPGAHDVAANLIPEEGSLGVRIPDHAFCRMLIERLGHPIVSTSANLSGEPAAATLEQVAAPIRQGVDYTVDPACEGTPTCRPSTILLFTEEGTCKIIRE